MCCSRGMGLTLNKIAKKECSPPYIPKIDKRNPARNFGEQTSPVSSFAYAKKQQVQYLVKMTLVWC
eukprot:gnl/Chilomastix_caulleri/7183.p1 GENE.gnl/Chilomastix_caulleri/7183~~gnl/Chilomastix_caulleri/7183.p1  ORF type:complete len:66 (+),score=10.22 gnl/Chilomastix_caulleri/7183:303-500(+)